MIDIVQKNNKIYFNHDKISFGNISIKSDIVTINMIKVTKGYRNKGYATKLLKAMINYITIKLLNIKSIILSPLPLEFDAMTLDSLIKFYSKHGFSCVLNPPKHSPYLMILNK
jgi:GNAT superfamily N-acetyltransferase